MEQAAPNDNGGSAVTNTGTTTDSTSGTLDSNAISPTIMPVAAVEPPSTSTPMEMDDLSSPPAVQHTQPSESTSGNYATGLPENAKENQRPEPDSSISPLSTNVPASSSPPSATSPSNSNPQLHPVLVREETTAAIGASTDEPITQSKSASATGPQLLITLLINTGARHPYRIDEKYLKKRNVSVPDNNPVNMSVYTLKELIWRDWRDEWEPRPSSPSSIRLIHFGKLLDDKAHLKDGRFATGDSPHVVHMIIKPQDVIDDEDARIAKGGGRDRDGNDRTPGCRCVIL